MEDHELFIKEERDRVAKLFSSKHRTGFTTKENFQDWFLGKLTLQQFSCYYCDTSIFAIRKLINAGKLGTRRTGYGERGPVLEVDRKTNSEGYSTVNCVLSCYYCNNDKSYTLDGEEYKIHFGRNRNVYLTSLLTKHNL